MQIAVGHSPAAGLLRESRPLVCGNDKYDAVLARASAGPDLSLDRCHPSVGVVFLGAQCDLQDAKRALPRRTGDLGAISIRLHPDDGAVPAALPTESVPLQAARQPDHPRPAAVLFLLSLFPRAGLSAAADGGV